MKNVKMLIFLLVMALLQLNCEEELPPRNIHYFIIVNNITDSLIQDFQEKIAGGNAPLVIRHNIEEGDVTFTVLLTTPTFTRAEVLFSQYEVSPDKRKALSDGFIAELKKLKEKKIPEQYIIRSHQFLLQEMSAPNTDYRILNAAGLVENSGVSRSKTGDRESWLNGNFYFSDGQNCLLDPVTEAKRQLDDPTSTLYKTLISINKNNTLPAGQKIYYTPDETGLHKIEGGCSSSDVIEFWEKLYNAVHLTPRSYSKGIKAFLQDKSIINL